MSRYITEILISVIGIVVSSSIPFIYGINKLITGNERLESVLTLLLVMIIVYFGFLLRLQMVFGYYKHDKDKSIIIDMDESILQWKDGEHTETIPFSTIYLIYKFRSSGYETLFYYKLIFKEPLSSGRENIIITCLTTSCIEKYLENIDFRRKYLLNLFLPKNSE